MSRVRRRMMMAAAAAGAEFEPYVIGPSNKTFDTDASGWTVDVSGSLVVQDAVYGVAPKALTIGSVDFWGNEFGQVRCDSVSASPGWVIKVDLNATYPPHDDAWASVTWQNAANATLREDMVNMPSAPTASLVPVTTTLPPAPAGTASMYLRVGVNGTGTWYESVTIDDVYLTRIA